MQTTQIKDFTKGPIAKELLIFSLPLFFSNLLQIVYNMVDMIIIGNHLGKNALSSVAVGGDVSQLLTFLAIGFSGAGQVIIARLIGAKRHKEIGTFVGTMTGFLLAAALVVSVVGFLMRHTLLELMHTPAEAYQGALEYSAVCMVGLVFIYGYNIVSAILRGMGDSKHPFIFISIAAVLNLVLDVVFVLFMGMGAGGVDYMVTGVGLNVNQTAFPPELSDRAVSLLGEMRRMDFSALPLDRTGLLCCFLREMEQAMDALEAGGFEAIRADYEALSATIGQAVQVIAPRESYTGVAQAVDDTGALLVRREDGTVETVLCGDVSVRGLMGYV